MHRAAVHLGGIAEREAVGALLVWAALGVDAQVPLAIRFPTLFVEKLVLVLGRGSLVKAIGKPDLTDDERGGRDARDQARAYPPQGAIATIAPLITPPATIHQWHE